MVDSMILTLQDAQSYVDDKAIRTCLPSDTLHAIRSNGDFERLPAESRSGIHILNRALVT